MKTSLAFLLLICCHYAICQDTHQQNEVRPLSQFVGYYNVGVKPNRPFFKSRWYLKNDALYTIYDSDIDRKFEPYVDGKLNYNVFYSEDNLPKISEDDTTYYVVLNFKDDRLDHFKIIRPRSEWPTDLYGYRIPELDELAIYPEAQMSEELTTEHFKYIFNTKDDALIRKFSKKIESRHGQLLQDFGIQSIPETTFKVYPDLESYHNGVLTPGAPAWQKGRVWTENEIKLVSPTFLDEEIGETISDDLLLHEYVHILHWNKTGDPNVIPKWLWEGVALYKGCCEWEDIEQLEYLKNDEFPSLKEINRNSELQYQLGYYIIEFIVANWKWQKVIQLIEHNGDIKGSLGLSSRAFEKAFYTYLKENYLE